MAKVPPKGLDAWPAYGISRIGDYKDKRIHSIEALIRIERFALLVRNLSQDNKVQRSENSKVSNASRREL